MAGHSKWANIQFRKGAQDKKRGKLFTKLIREITTAARMGGGDPDANPRLRLAIDKALSNNMAKDNIERAIKRGNGDLDDAHYEEVQYEGYGVKGVAVMVECLTDNRNRTVAEVRHAFSKFGGNLGESGSVAYLFNRCGVISFGPGSDEDRILETVIEAGAEDVQSFDDQSIEVLTSPENYRGVRDALSGARLEPDEADVVMRPTVTIALEVDAAVTTLKMLDMLEDLDDVQRVYSNADMPEAAYQQL